MFNLHCLAVFAPIDAGLLPPAFTTTCDCCPSGRMAATLLLALRPRAEHEANRSPPKDTLTLKADIAMNDETSGHTR